MKDNRVIWITGASSGIGEALVRAYARRSVRLVLSSRREEELQRVARESELSDDRYLILPMDMTAIERFPQYVEQVIKRFGAIDILYNNAGISTRALALESPLEIDRKVMEINYFGPIALSKQVVPRMVEQGSGHVVITSSVTGKIGTARRSAYAASKHALHGFYDSLRAELCDTGVNITLLCPGYIRTRISLNAITESGERYNRMNRQQEHGKDPDALARKVIKAVDRKKKEVYYGGIEILGIYIKRYVPGLLYGILNKQHRANTYLK